MKGEKMRKIDEIPSEFGDKEIEYAYDKLVKKCYRCGKRIFSRDFIHNEPRNDDLCIPCFVKILTSMKEN